LRVVGRTAVGHRALSEAFVHYQALCGAWNEGLLHYKGSRQSYHRTGRQMGTRTIHPNTTHFASEAAAINDAARRALWSVSNTFRDRIKGTDFRFVPSRFSGTENTVVPMGDFRDSRVDILARVTAALNTDLEGRHDSSGTSKCTSKDSSAKAQLAGQQPPEEADTSCPSRSPPRKRLRYSTPAATTRLQ
jgi:hypothetical protein